MKVAWLFILLTIVTMGNVSQRPIELRSPDGKIRLKFSVQDNSGYYSISYKGDQVIEDSPLLRMRFKGMESFGRNLEVLDLERNNVDNTYNPIWGTEEEVRDHYNQIVVTLRERNDHHRLAKLTFRAYNDGVAFRYGFFEQDGMENIEIISEDTQFHFPANYRVWALKLDVGETPQGFLRYSSGYEGYYNQTTLKEIDPLIGMPLLIETGAAWLAITEANSELFRYVPL